MRAAEESEHASNNCPNCGCRTTGPRLRICEDCKPIVARSARPEAKATSARWRMVWSGDPYWPAGGCFTETDLEETLRIGNFPPNAVLQRGSRWYQVREAGMRGLRSEIRYQRLIEVNRNRLRGLLADVRKRT